jgi:ABC-type transport system involved in multi-copper enzyme maturation permease subunit
MTRFWLDAWWVAVYELGEAVRTRLFQLVLVGWLGVLGVANWILVEFLREAEGSFAATLGVPRTEKPGAMIAQLIQRGELVDFLAPLVGGRGSAQVLLHEPIIGLWASATTMACLPVLLAFTASGSIAGEVKSRSIRYLACRTGRLQIGLGKIAGQLFLAAVAALFGIVLTVGMSQTLMVQVPMGELVLVLLDRTLRALAFALPFAGLALAVSMLVPNPNGARVTTAAVMLGMRVVARLAQDHVDDSLPGRFADLVTLFCAHTTWGDYWSTDPAVLGAAVGRSCILAIVYFAAGHVRFGTRDL